MVATYASVFLGGLEKIVNRVIFYNTIFVLHMHIYVTITKWTLTRKERRTFQKLINISKSTWRRIFPELLPVLLVCVNYVKCQYYLNVVRASSISHVFIIFRLSLIKSCKDYLFICHRQNMLLSTYVNTLNTQMFRIFCYRFQWMLKVWMPQQWHLHQHTRIFPLSL